MIEYLMSPLLILYVAGSTFLGYSSALNPAEQRDRASAATAKSYVAAICRAQAICMVENDPSQCNSLEAVEMSNIEQKYWTYSFVDRGTEYSQVTANGTLSGTNFTLTCTNDRSDPNFAEVVCFDDGAGAGNCENLNLSPIPRQP